MFSGLGSLRLPASCGALVWTVYGVSETTFVVAVPAVRRWLDGVLDLPRSGSQDFTNPALSALALVAYPCLGALTTAAVALACRRWTPTALSAHRAAPEIQFWSGVSLALLCAAFAANAVYSHGLALARVSLAPAAIAAACVRGGWERSSAGAATEPTARGALTTGAVLMLVACAVVAQPRDWWPVRWQVPFELGIVALTMVVVRLVERFLARSPDGWPTEWRAYRAVVSTAAVAVLVGTGIAARPSPGEVITRAPAPTRAGDQRPPVVLIALDTVRADHLSAYGCRRDTTPHLREFAATSTLYEHCWSTGSWTLPGMASVITGRYPWAHGARHLPGESPAPIDAAVPTLAERLAASGYLTAGFAANSAFVIASFGFDRGFERFEAPLVTGMRARTERSHLLREDVQRALIPQAGVRIVDASTLNARIFDFLRATGPLRQPLFLFVNYMAAHDPYLPPAPFAEMFPRKVESFDWARFGPLVQEVSVRGDRGLADEEREHLISQYYGAIAYVDHEVGRLFDRLHGQGRSRTPS